ncbi:MAG: hypothetical protein Q8928_19105 [Bacteroidota bacterium]|nr:hypothetical protein [Bacteroidota bacterium]
MERVVLYNSKTKEFYAPEDSLVLLFRKGAALPDTIGFRTSWKYPGYLKMKIKFSDRKRVSNIFQYSSGRSAWNVFVEDAELKVKPKPAGDNFRSRNSLKGVVLILQTVLEMLLALLISRIMGWPHVIVPMVLVANIAAYPIYLLGFDNILYRELSVFFIKSVVMVLVGVRKVSVYKIVALAVVLTLIGFGFKEFLFFVGQIL